MNSNILQFKLILYIFSCVKIVNIIYHFIDWLVFQQVLSHRWFSKVLLVQKFSLALSLSDAQFCLFCPPCFFSSLLQPQPHCQAYTQPERGQAGTEQKEHASSVWFPQEDCWLFGSWQILFSWIQRTICSPSIAVINLYFLCYSPESGDLCSLNTHEGNHVKCPGNCKTNLIQY